MERGRRRTVDGLRVLREGREFYLDLLCGLHIGLFIALKIVDTMSRR